MNYKITYKQFILAATISVVSAATTQSLAGEDDFTQPITVDSKSQFVDGKNKSSIFSGNVNITQGSLVIDADEVEVDASLGEGKEIFIARGTPAKYSQELDDKQRVIATAEEIRYNVSKKMISLSGAAELQREASSVSGSSIVYDMVNEQLLAESNDGNDTRVTTVFRPEAIKDITDGENSGQDNKGTP
ncbi:lipopolysaccharide transport periplasmic protein LptA [Alteromonas sp. 5E99-2]|uniref:lipopolysaccharide transport periplasmic protein LptA n=1 Tax=Alteromonas sp. 5E99-2 TaxID=2817683 RepID=UPI001A98A267|nr:lipopolysaccharide transport periplasmic protein LptA [Alteromonas sp. 5E99-2]MBO1254297.1 lipopolysaccharide transport periplasmic protein LptA [Alteromonas sp. 5E99-2]